jgi:hypothetical protein
MAHVLRADEGIDELNEVLVVRGHLAQHYTGKD